MIGFDRADPGDWAVVTFSLGSYFGDGAEIGNPLPSIVKGPVAVEIETLVATASQPLGVAFIDPGDLGRFIYYEKTGRVRLVDEGALQSGDFLSVAGRLVNLGGANDERGLLGLTLHPDFASNRLLYTYTSEPIAGSPDFTAFPGGSTNHHAVIAEWAVDASDPDAVDVATRREILRIAQPQGNHNGGALRFGPDGMLYIALGDGGGADDEGGGHAPEGNGQRTDVILGSILRIDVGGNNSANGRYGVPATNPFVGGAGIDEIFHYGLRNPFSFSFDSLTGEIYIGDVGQRDIEEVNRLAAGVVGVNFGWRLKEGTFFFDPTLSAVVTIPVAPIPPGVVDPIAQYDHGDGSSAIGGFVYRGSAIPELAGRYVCADLNGKLFYIDAAGTLLQLKIGLDDRAFGTAIVGFGQDPAGEIYVCGGVGLFKLIPIPAPAAAKGWAGYRKR
jgi:glucose/arabinose dehydrogenase